MLKFGLDFRLTDPTVNEAPFDLNANFYSSVQSAGCGGPVGTGPVGTGPVGTGPAPGMGGVTVGGGGGLPQFICGIAESSIIAHNTEQKFRFQNWSLFAQDTWKIASRVTLTYGARYEINPAPYSLNGKPLFSLTHFDPMQCTTTPQFVQGTTICNVGIAPLGTPPYPTTWGNIAPRIGVAYQMFRNANWGNVLRAGFGTFYDTGNDAASSTLGPFSPSAGFAPGLPPGVCNPASAQFPLTDSGCTTPPPIQANIGPNSPYASVAQAAAPNLKLPFSYEFNVSIQQALGSQQSLRGFLYRSYR